MDPQTNSSAESSKTNYNIKKSSLAVGMVIGAVVTTLYTLVISPLLFPTNEIPNTSKVKQGFVPPSRLEIKV